MRETSRTTPPPARPADEVGPGAVRRARAASQDAPRARSRDPRASEDGAGASHPPGGDPAEGGRTVATALLALGALTAFAAVPADLGDWREVAHEDGIVASERPVPGRELPTFRGLADVAADVDTVLAILQDVPRHPEWMHDCVEARLLAVEPDGVTWVYHRTDVPWPASDRDVVLRSAVEVVEPGRLVYLRFASVASPLMPAVPGVVRIPRLEGYYRLEAFDHWRTRVEYVVDADPGGILPAWIARPATRGQPLFTLRKLRLQVERVRGLRTPTLRTARDRAPRL